MTHEAGWRAALAETSRRSHHKQPKPRPRRPPVTQGKAVLILRECQTKLLQRAAMEFHNRDVKTAYLVAAAIVASAAREAWL